MNADDRVLLLDLENLGSARLRPRPLRARLETLLDAAGETHHVVAAYAVPECNGVDPVASVLAELRIAPLRVPTGPDAAELALLARARHVHAEGGRIFIVGSADGRFAELATFGRAELLVWDGQPVATKLAEVVHDVRRLTRPTGTPAEDTTEHVQHHPDAQAAATNPATMSRRDVGDLIGRLLIAVITGIGIAVGQRLFDAVVPRRQSRRRSRGES
ncbi:hypothetical protein Lesp02_02580 [Lentzea sp. NBRC 105346]|uniref:hypothetical protein n=1 Tax=Lentzea sp. NBRC 105346 TaxID=3032205 RepID=UPI0024A101D7|nr:hypothetical protein [Lentzea sp. NBRC 105346]GLZ28068.1 hypothetical protein Lesp02_02580 [Lentzea sp. NBRC 105346]